MIQVDLTPREALEQFFGFSKFKGEQESIIQSVLDGQNTFVIMPTGGGKSLCYQLPALMMEGTAIVVSPLIALMKNQVDSIRGFSDVEGVAHFLNSSLTRNETLKVRKDITEGRTKILFVAPESLTKKENVEFLTDIKISFFAIDEAHCISEWGHDFRPEYRRLRTIFDEIKRVPVIALTATATEKVQEDILKNLDIPDAKVYKDSFNRPNLYYEIRPKKDVGREIIRFIKQHDGRSGIIYCLSRKKVEEMAEMLNVNGIKALPYHAGMDAHQRASHQDQFLMEEVDVIVATIAFGMGIDKGDVQTVVHWDAPPDPESYYQEAGRAGRNGDPAYAILLVSKGDAQRLTDRVLGSFPTVEEVRTVYQAFANEHRIALGSGLDETYALDIRGLMQRTGATASTVNNALKTLELNGDIALSEGVKDPSRVMMLATQSTIHGMRVQGNRNSSLLEALLRGHGGIFEAPVIIEEDRLARMAQMTPMQVESGLRELEQLEVLTYVKRNDAPRVTLLTPRRDAALITPDPLALGSRKERALERLGIMVEYMTDHRQCRERTLLNYFGEADIRNCGRCDVCKASERDTTSGSLQPTEHADGADLTLIRWAMDEDGDANTRVDEEA